MTNATKKPVVLNLGDFTVECLGVDYPDCFQGYGVAFSDYTDCCYGIGDTEAVALEDCMEMMAQSGRIEWTDEVECRIRDEYGRADDSVTAADELGVEDDDACEEYSAYWHVGIKWNVREEQRLQRVRKIPNVQPLRYEDYCAVERDSDGYSRRWGTVCRADGSASYGDFKDTDWPDSARAYLDTLSDDEEETGDLYFYVPYASGSDYSGCTVTKANAKWFEDTFGENEWVHSVYGGHGTYAVAVGLTGLLGCDDDTFESICEALEGLDNYPVFDDEAVSEFESECANEAWDSWVADDFVRALEAKFADCADLELPNGDALRAFFEEKREDANTYWECEGCGPSVYIRIERVVEGIEFDDVASRAVRYEVSHNDCGERREDYYLESEAIERVDTLRAAGFCGASYTVHAPDTSDK